MAKKRVKVIDPELIDITSDNHMDALVGEAATKQSEVDEIINRYNADEQLRRKKEVTDKVAARQKRIDIIIRSLQAYCDENRARLLPDEKKKKSVDLTHGKVGWRSNGGSVVAKKGFTLGGIADLLKETLFSKKFLRTKVELAKEQIAEAYSNWKEMTDEEREVSSAQLEECRKKYESGDVDVLDLAVPDAISEEVLSKMHLEFKTKEDFYVEYNNAVEVE